jgi:hypothetical protein
MTQGSYGSSCDQGARVAASEDGRTRTLVREGTVGPASAGDDIVPCRRSPDETFEGAMPDVASQHQGVDSRTNSPLHQGHGADSSHQRVRGPT